MNNTTFIINDTLNENINTLPSYVGFICLLISVIFFGSVYVPVKKFETGDGLFFQLILCIGIWTVSFVINCIRNFPVFYALPLLSGFLWTTANMITVPVIKCIGLALGLLISGTSSIVVGWAYARFGGFGIKPQVPKIPWMNYVGFGLALISGFFYIFVKPDIKKIETEKYEKNEVELNPINQNAIYDQENKIKKQQQSDIFDRLSTTTKRILGILMSIYGGSSFAFTFAPILYIIDNYENSSKNALDYVFSQYTGIVVTSITYFIIYCIIKKNKPLIYEKIILPTFISGLLWGSGNCCFLIASTILSQSVTFPMLAAGPPMVGIFYSIFIFKEIKGKRNYLILSIGFIILTAGSIFSGLSK